MASAAPAAATAPRLAVIGAGWAGLACAVAAVQQGWQVVVFEAAREAGGRARALPVGADGLRLDNGQHILIGAYTATLELMRTVGVTEAAVLRRQPLSLRRPNGNGLATPAWAASWPAPLDALAAIATARGWSISDRMALMTAAVGWQWRQFKAPLEQSVADLSQALPAKVRDELIAPLCVSALNTPMQQASAAVFLVVLRDALFGVRGGSQLLLPTADLSDLLPRPALAWLQARGAQVRLGHRVQALQRAAAAPAAWQVDDEAFDAVALACPPKEAVRLLRTTAVPNPAYQDALDRWVQQCEALRFQAIATVYLQLDGTSRGPLLPQPMLALPDGADSPAQFVFDRAALDGQAGLLACVVSAAEGELLQIQEQVLAQIRRELRFLLDASALRVLRTVVEKRATFACSPGLVRPSGQLGVELGLAGLVACGDWLAGPYPATLEGAVRSGQWAAQSLSRRAPTLRA